MYNLRRCCALPKLHQDNQPPSRPALSRWEPRLGENQKRVSCQHCIHGEWSTVRSGRQSMPVTLLRGHMPALTSHVTRRGRPTQPHLGPHSHSTPKCPALCQACQAHAPWPCFPLPVLRNQSLTSSNSILTFPSSLFGDMRVSGTYHLKLRRGESPFKCNLHSLDTLCANKLRVV